jgi:hypothetical protein
MRVNIKPDVITRMVRIVILAQTQRLRRTGAKYRRDKTPDRAKKTTVPHMAQLMGGRNGMGTGVNCESCSARGWASKPLSKGKDQKQGRGPMLGMHTMRNPE